MSTVRWSDIRDKHVEAIGREDVERGTSRLISQVRAHRLADMRKRRGVTQREVAQAMGVTPLCQDLVRQFGASGSQQRA
jgi:hypothetical protein